MLEHARQVRARVVVIHQSQGSLRLLVAQEALHRRTHLEHLAMGDCQELVLFLPQDSANEEQPVDDAGHIWERVVTTTVEGRSHENQR